MNNKGCSSFVHLDGIWKSHTKKELLAQARFQERWGYISEICKELQESSIPYQRKMEMSREKKEDKNLAQGDTGQQPFPQTSAQVIGWKSTNATAHSYGIQESRARRKCDFLQVLQWPYEGM